MRLHDIAKLVGTVVLATAAAAALANPMSTTENFYDRPGGDYLNFNAGSFAVCSSSCATDTQCKAYTYVTATGVCWKKSTVPARKSSNCCISGVKVMAGEEINVDRPGSDIKPGFPTGTDDQCETACKNDLKCLAYTWVKPGVQAQSGLCWLKNKRPVKVGNSCCISGVKLRDPVRIRAPSGDLQLQQ